MGLQTAKTSRCTSARAGRGHRPSTWSEESDRSKRRHQAINGKKARTFNEKIDFVGYANFQSHLFDWGVKMVTTRAFTQAEFFAYQFILTMIAEKEGGVRTAYFYDVKFRQYPFGLDTSLYMLCTVPCSSMCV